MKSLKHTSLSTAGSLKFFDLLSNFLVLFSAGFKLFDFKGVLIDELRVFLLVREYIFVYFFDFFLEIINFASDHGEFLLDAILIVSIDEFFVFLAYVL